MANIEKFIPFVIKWESGITRNDNESNESLFNRAKKRGYSNDKDDLGGETMVGITWKTYNYYCERKNIKNRNVKDIEYSEWVDILKSLYWDRWKADYINNQSVAELLCDFVWASGVHGIKRPQKILGVTVDGIVGDKTINALNAYPDKELFDKIKADRISFIDDICKARPANEKFRKGWLNRINDFKFEA